MENKNTSNDISWLDRDIKRWKSLGCLIPPMQHRVYEAIRDSWTSGRTVIDIGSSIGVGTNILSHNARFVWGIDVNEESIGFAKYLLERPNMDFEVLDIEEPVARPLSTFERIVCIEVIEHLPQLEGGLVTIKKFFGKNSIGFFSVPNLGNSRVKAADQNNPLHVNHWTAGEFYSLMIEHFESVTLFDGEKVRNWDADEMVDGDSQCRLIIAQVEGPKGV